MNASRCVVEKASRKCHIWCYPGSWALEHFQTNGGDHRRETKNSHRGDRNLKETLWIARTCG
jgi:hypothetical protein